MKRENKNDGNIQKFIALVKKLEKLNNKCLYEIQMANRNSSNTQTNSKWKTKKWKKKSNREKNITFKLKSIEKKKNSMQNEHE